MPAQHTAAAPLHLANELFGEPSLADARLAQDYRGPAPSPQCSAERFTQDGEFLLSVDQRRMTARAELACASFLRARPRLSPALAGGDNGAAARNDLAIDTPRFLGWLHSQLGTQSAHAGLVLSQRVPESPLLGIQAHQGPVSFFS